MFGLPIINSLALVPSQFPPVGGQYTMTDTVIPAQAGGFNVSAVIALLWSVKRTIGIEIFAANA
jgi:hypothetical protein